MAESFGLPRDVLKLVDVDVPLPGEAEAVVRVDAAAMNFADILFCQGKYQVRPEPPFTPGMEVAGTIELVGVHWGGYRSRQPEVTRDAHAALIDLYQSGAISPVVDTVIALEDVVAGLNRIATRHTTGRVGVVPELATS